MQAHSAGSHRDPYVSLPGASSIGPFDDRQSANSQKIQIGFAEHNKMQSGLKGSADYSDFAGFMREPFSLAYTVLHGVQARLALSFPPCYPNLPADIK